MFEDYLKDIDILELRTLKVGSGYVPNWIKVGIFRGHITADVSNASRIGGKVNEVSEYKAMGVTNDFLVDNNRLSYNGLVYRIKGKPKVSIHTDNYVSLELEYVTMDNLG